MVFASLLTRRAAVLALIGLATGPGQTEAKACSLECAAKSNKDKRKKCMKACRKRKKRQQGLPRTATLSGVGPMITSYFGLAAGRYRISATHTETDDNGGNFIVHLWGPHDYEGFLFNELPFDPGTYTYQTVEEVPYDGTYFVEVEYASGPWTISINPI